MHPFPSKKNIYIYLIFNIDMEAIHFYKMNKKNKKMKMA